MEHATPDVVTIARDLIAAGHARDGAKVASLSEPPDDTAIFTVSSAPDSNLTLQALLDHFNDYPPCALIGSQPAGYMYGDSAWVFDNPSVVVPGEGAISIRITVVLHKFAEGWKVVHAHLSEGVAHLE
ncbi:nuclear transport factor 2 family protein [Rhodococcus sp. NPDC127530]|uniref:nuclear transport factor 2 family protein n=1 Tax=unclassified Rhodococcus (in: high G+C Gram-positive bacteria) TaxID=192944 RepID=UPI003632C494